jgi:hypothetical protein
VGQLGLEFYLTVLWNTCAVFINFKIKFHARPVSIAARSKPSTDFGRSNIGIAGSNPAQGMDVCLCSLCCVVLCR